MIVMARFRGFVVVVSMLFVSLFCINIVSSLPEEEQITFLEENFVSNFEQPKEEISNEIQAYENFGDQEDFWTANLDTQEWFEVRATLLAVGAHCYIYMDNRTIVSMGQTQAIERCEILSSEFDSTVYPKNFELMGSPDGTLGDIDSDPRITVFLVEGVGSYYLHHNELPGTSNSNNREMVYVNSRMGLYNTIGVMCHEANHLFLFNYDNNEATFCIEGLAEFSMYNAGYMSNSSFMQGEMTLNVTMSASMYSNTPSVSLFFFDADYYSYASYGAGYIFMFYIAEKYGIEIIRDLISIAALDGPEAIEYVLSSHGYSISFNELFLDFITACTLDELGFQNDLYGFVNADFSINTKRPIYELPFSISNIKHRYYNIEIQEIVEIVDNFTLEIETPETPRSLGVVVAINDDHGWNITQLILTGDGTTAQLLCEGENITEAYLITSLIREGTPSAPRSWGESPYNLLDITIKAGHPSKTTDKTSIAFLAILPLIVAVVVFRRRLKN